ncbi:putative short-chain dehydrogenase/reductase SDR, NAD(P)-binding domain superfamily [Helianthus anomalus]
MASKRIAVVTGGNKGIGFEICKQLLASSSHDVLVVVTARDEQKGLQALHKLKTLGLSENTFVFRQLDVTDPSSITSFADFIGTQFGKLDILVNNAGITGIFVDEGSVASLKPQPGEDTGVKTYMAKQVMLQTYETAKDCIQTNYYGTKHVTEALLPFLCLSSSPRIVNISSGVGKLEKVEDKKASQMLSDVDKLTEEVVEEVVTRFLCNAKDGLLEEKGWNAPLSAYIVSKAVINAYTRILANKYASFRINAFNPGFTKTDMTHHKGTYTVEEGARGAVWLALMPDEGPSGRFFFQMEETTF